MKTSLLTTKLVFFLIMSFMLNSNCNSQTKDSLENKICHKKIIELYGAGVSYTGPLSVDEVEKQATTTIEKDGKRETLPFGFLNENWIEIKSKMKKGDKIFKFTTDPESWANLAGREGFIVLRGDVVIGTMITMMN